MNGSPRSRETPGCSSCAELAGQWSDAQAQVADYTAAIEALPGKNPGHGRRLESALSPPGQRLRFALRQWQQAVDDYAHVVTDTTTDVDLLAKRARAYGALKNWDAAAADSARAATGNRQGPRILAEFARELAAGDEFARAKVQFEKAQELYERSLEADPDNDAVAAGLAQVLLDKQANANAALSHHPTDGKPATLGRFRLSVSHDPSAFEKELRQVAASKVADPWLRLAAAYALIGHNDAALRYLSRALERADGYEARKTIVEFASGFDEVLSGLLKRQPDDPQLQLAWTRKLADRGRASGREAARPSTSRPGGVPRDCHAAVRPRPATGPFLHRSR